MSLSSIASNVLGRLAELYAWPIVAFGLKGECGAVNETGTDAVAGDFDAIQCLTDTIFTTLTEGGGDTYRSTGDALTGLTLPAGTILYGRFTAFTLTSGAVRAYKRGPS